MGKITDILTANAILAIGLLLYVIDSVPYIQDININTKPLGAVIIFIYALFGIINKFTGKRND